MVSSIALFMGFEEDTKEPLKFSEEDKAKLDKEAGDIKGFAEKFEKKFNAQLAIEADNNGARQMYADFMAEQPEVAEGEESEEQTVPSADDGTVSTDMKALIAKNKTLKEKNQQLAADNEKLKIIPEEDKPEAIVKLNPKATVKHSATHLFASGHSYDALDRPWNKAVAESNIKASTDWGDAVNIDKLNEDLGAYSRRNSKEIMSMFKDGYSIPDHWKVITNIQDEHVMAQLITGEITQGLKKKWLPKNKQRFQPVKNKIFDKQIDATWSGFDLKNIEKSWLNMFFNEGSTPHKMGFVRYLLVHIMKQAREEDKISVFRGVFKKTADDSDIAGSFLNSMNGFLKIVDNNKGLTYQPHKLGVPTEANILDYVNNWVRLLPYEFRIQPGLKFGLSDDHHKAYHRARERSKGVNTDYKVQDTYVEQYSNIEFVPHAQFNGSGFMYITTEDNIYLMVDRPDEASALKLQLNKRDIDAFGDYKLGVGIGGFGAKIDPDAKITYEDQIFFSNDVEVLTDVTIPVAPDDETPSVKGHIALSIGEGNTSATNITKFDDVVAGKKYYLYGNADTNISTIVSNANNLLDGGNFPLAKGNVLVVIGQADGKVIEYKRTLATDPEAVDKKVLAAGATTADAIEGNYFLTSANTAATALTTIENAIEEEEYTIEGGSDTNSTTIANSGNFALTAAFTAAAGAKLSVVYNGTKFIEVSRA